MPWWRPTAPSCGPEAGEIATWRRAPTGGRAADPARRLELEGAWNFRDLGGYRARDGRRLRWRRLFRADGLDRLTATDLEQIERLRLRTVIDLRTGDEVARGRLATTAGRGRLVPPPDARRPSAPGPLRHLDRPVRRPSSTSAWSPPPPTTVAAFLAWSATRHRYPLVFHCFAGKDRTGILTALVLGLLGVADDDIAADYALSGRGHAPPPGMAAGPVPRRAPTNCGWSPASPPSWPPNPRP